MTRQYRNDGRDQIPIENVHGNVYIQESARLARSRSESLLLQAVKQEVISRLAQSLHNAVFINLGMQSQPQQVKRPWDAEIKIGSKSPEPLPAETTILEVFDRTGIDGRLLILGEPGAGKTTTILDLAEKLCDRAEQDANAFIPVLLNLSSWKDPKQTMTDWLVEELKSKYGVRKAIGQQWLAEKQLLPLLDGLNEVKPEQQKSCVEAINRWLASEDRPLSIAVCCRREEYENYKRQLNLNGATCLQDLTSELIQDYLSRVDLPEFWQMLQADTALLESVRKPLFLRIVILSYSEITTEQWQEAHSTGLRWELLLDTYVRLMLARDFGNRAYRKGLSLTTERMRHWLVFLAKQLQKESQTEFLVERISFSWLIPRRKKRFENFRKVTSLLSYIIFAAISGIIGNRADALFLLLTSDPATFVASTINSVNTGVVGGFLGLLFSLLGLLIRAVSLSDRSRQLVESIHWSWQDFKDEFITGIVIGACISAILGLVLAFILIAQNKLLLGLTASCSLGMSFGASYGILNGLVSGIRSSERMDKVVPNQGIWESAKNFLFTALAFSLTISLVLRLFIDFWGIIYGLIFGLSCGLLVGGGRVCIEHLYIRYLLFRSGSIPWNYARFLNYCTERLLLQRVGGRYRFMHKSLQEHFAAMSESGVENGMGEGAVRINEDD